MRKSESDKAARLGACSTKDGVKKVDGFRVSLGLFDNQTSGGDNLTSFSRNLPWEKFCASMTIIQVEQLNLAISRA